MSSVDRFATITILSICVFAVNACRGDISRDPPVHLNQNMDQQSRYDPQEANSFFKDGRAMRPSVKGTVARGTLFHPNQKWASATQSPVALTPKILARGQERYAIYCSPCHGRNGEGAGPVTVVGIEQGMTPPPKYSDERLQAMPLGQIFDVISNGVRTMPAYAAQIPPEDRWAIASYIRVHFQGADPESLSPSPSLSPPLKDAPPAQDPEAKEIRGSEPSEPTQ